MHCKHCVLENSIYVDNEIIFENANFKLNVKQLSNETLEFKHVDKRKIIMKELPSIFLWIETTTLITQHWW